MWPTQKVFKGKSKGQPQTEKSYAGLAGGNLIHISLQVEEEETLEIQLIVAERNFAKEYKPRSSQHLYIGTPRVRQVYCLMLKTVTDQLVANQMYCIKNVARVPTVLSYENLLAITSLQPNYTEWLTVASGIPLHPQYVNSRKDEKSTSLSSFEKIRILLFEAKHIRKLCKEQDGQWKEPEVAKETIAKYIL